MKKLLLFVSLIASSTAINAQWTEQNTGFIEALRGLGEIRVVDANAVWAVAYDGSGAGADIQEFTRTADGGATWTWGTIDIGDSTLKISNLSAVSDQIAWVGAFDENLGLGSVYKTIDGGVQWVQQNAGTSYQTANESWFDAVHFFDANVGLTMGDPENGYFEIYKTIDGGDTWNRISSASLPAPLSGEYGYAGSYNASGDSFWFETNKGRIYRTADKGVTWTAAQVPGLSDFGGISATTGNGTRADVIFSNANTGYLLKDVITGTTTNHVHTRTFMTTTNGGATWGSAAAFTGTRFILNYVPGTTTIVATSQAAPVGTSVSIDNGTSWTDVESGDQRGASGFIGTTGWTAGFNESEFVGGIFKLTSPLGTHNVEAVAKFKVYPNPATSSVTISAAEVDSYKLNVTDISGKTVMTKSLNGIENTLDISSLSSGAYFFELSSDSKREVVKILKN